MLTNARQNRQVSACLQLTVGRVSACRSSAKTPLFQNWLIRNDSNFKAVEKVSACRSYAKTPLFQTWLIRKSSQFKAVGKGVGLQIHCENSTIPNLANPKKLQIQGCRKRCRCRLIDPRRKFHSSKIG